MHTDLVCHIPAHFVVVTCLTKELILLSLTCIYKTGVPVKSIQCVKLPLHIKKTNIKVIMSDLHVKTLNSNLVKGFNGNFFDQYQLFFFKKKLKFFNNPNLKISKIFTLNNSIKC